MIVWALRNGNNLRQRTLTVVCELDCKLYIFVVVLPSPLKSTYYCCPDKKEAVYDTCMARSGDYMYIIQSLQLHLKN